MKKTRKTGQIRTYPTPSVNPSLSPIPSPSLTPTPTLLPHNIQSLSINNINIYSQMQTINSYNDDIFKKYQKIIEDLEEVIRELEERNWVIEGERYRLMEENLALRRQVDGGRAGDEWGDRAKSNRDGLFQVVAEEDSIPVVLTKSAHTRKINHVLQQSSFDIPAIHHHYTQQVSAQLSLSSPQPSNPKSQQRTPCLHSPHTQIQSKSQSNNSPLRIFYLLLLQQKPYINKLQQFLNECLQDEDKILMSLFPSDNGIWGKILGEFLEAVVKGKWDNQREIVEYIGENPLIDMLLVALLKYCLPIGNQDQDLNIGDWKHQEIDHRALFLGLCNHFDLKFQQDPSHLLYKLYPIDPSPSPCKSPLSSKSQQMLLQSRTVSNKNFQAEHQKQQLQRQPQNQNQNQFAQISLFDRNGQNNLTVGTGGGTQAMVKKEPIFKIWVDPERIYYRVNVSIRPGKFGDLDGVETNSFHRTDNQCQSQSQSCSQISKQQQVYRYKNLLQPKDLNLNPNRTNLTKPNPRYKLSSDYIQPNQSSKQISYNNSFACSQRIE